jgi:hypothetical protein
MEGRVDIKGRKGESDQKYVKGLGEGCEQNGRNERGC